MKALALRGTIGIVAAGSLLLAGCSSVKNDDSGSPATGNGGSSAPVKSDDITGDTNGISSSVLDSVKGQALNGPAGSGLTRGVTSTSIKVGCVSLNAFFPNVAKAYSARFDRANAEGGINGRKIDFSGCSDDGANADTNLAASKRLVEQEKDFAVMNFSTFATPQVTDYLNKNQVPFFGWGFVPGFCGNRWGFGFNGCVVSSGINSIKTGWAATSNTYPLRASGLAGKDVKIALLGSDNDASRASNKDWSATIKANGGKVVFAASSMPVTGATDFTSYVRPVIAANPNAVLINIGLDSLGKVIATLRAGGYKGLITSSSGYQPGLLKAQPALGQALEGSWSVSYTTPIEQSTPFNTQMLKDFKQNGTPTGQGTIFAYEQADMLVEMLKATGKDLNTKTFDQTINNGSFTYKADPSGGAADISFPAGHFTAADCTAAMQVVKGNYVVKGKYACFQSVKSRG